MNSKDKLIQSDAILHLRARLPAGSEIGVILRHVAPSGMKRWLSLVVVWDGKIQDITYLAAQALGDKLVDKHGSNTIAMGGCGMDMGFALVYNLSRVLFPAGFIPADAGLRYGRNGTPATALDTDGGYALKARWL